MSTRIERWIEAVNDSPHILRDLYPESVNPTDVFDGWVATDDDYAAYLVYRLNDGQIIRDFAYEVAWDETYDGEVDDVNCMLSSDDVAWAYFRIVAEDPSRVEFIRPLAKFLDIPEWYQPAKISLKELEYMLTVRHPLPRNK